MTEHEVKIKHTPITNIHIALVPKKQYNEACEEIQQLKTRLEKALDKIEEKSLENVIIYESSEFITLESVREELSLMANSMSTQKALASKFGVTQSFLCGVINGRKKPGSKILKFLKLRKIQVYVEIKDGRNHTAPTK